MDVGAVCPVTGLAIFEPKHWFYRSSNSNYTGRLYLVGEHVMVWQPKGVPALEDGEGVTRHIYRAIDEAFAPGITFHAFFDYSGLENPPIANRLRVLKNLRETAGKLKRIYFYGMNRTVRTIVRLSVQISGLSEKIIICRDYRQAIELANEYTKKLGKQGSLLPVYQQSEIRNLVEIIGTIVWNRDYDVLIPELPGEHPLSELYNALDVMRHDLQQLDEQNRDAMQRLEEANRAKSDFLANVSHEIRTPLGGIIGAAELLQNTALNDEQQHFLQILQGSSEALMSGVNDVLDLSKLEQGAMAIVPRPTNLSALLNGIATIFRPRCRKKGLELFLTCEADEKQEYLVDPIRLRQILMNLLHNALKFTPTGSIRLDCRSKGIQKEDGELMYRHDFSVQDTGIGIPQEKIETIFEKFTQIHNTEVQNFGGSGLGLHIAAVLVAKLGGTLEVVSEAGKGSRFFFTLLLPKSEEKALWNQEPETIRKTFFGKVLLAEDDEANRFIISSLLNSYGCEVRQAVNGRMALDCIEHERFDIVFMDCQMPILSGREAVKILRKRNDAIGDIPVVAVTAYAAEDTELLTDYGFDAIIAKPVRGRDLEPILRLFLEERPIGQEGSPPPPPWEQRRWELISTERIRNVPHELQRLEVVLSKEDEEQEAEMISHSLKGFFRTMLYHHPNPVLLSLAEELDKLVHEGRRSEGIEICRRISRAIEGYREGEVADRENQDLDCRG
ncbi:ATP-binding protein [Sediminispirochaeta smaragdinae]|uniref:histidine kinase n=1 Tax=Sediminispirochaeta smaragdinae (strain DSM 11293 / JCM 15392 / SEBR 4228) TaxID=573413 RepID=E1R484_SEDSS|nr:ATP-binding protein [Sediminispirochaeta smaragdinae]ADK80506.1 histidine kinase [Sediminispirochaeta smaragdinae DSM 11293]